MKLDSPLAKAGIALAFFVLAALLAVAAVGEADVGGAAGDPKLRMVILFVSMIGVLFFAGSLGATPQNSLVDAYNRASLQQALTFAWFVLLSGAFLGLSLYNTMLWKAGQETVAFFVSIPETVWILAGITLGGLAGDAAIKTALAERADGPPAETNDPNRAGLMFQNVDPDQAKPSDIISNARYGSQASTDLGAVQQLMFQAVLLIGYTIAVFKFAMTSDGKTPFAALPAIPGELLYLIFGSTLGALVTKANGGRPAATQPNSEAPPSEAVFEQAPQAAAAAVASYASVDLLRASAADTAARAQSEKAAALAREAQTVADEIYTAPAFHLGNGTAFRFILWVVSMMKDEMIGPDTARLIARDHIDGLSNATSNVRSMYLANLALAERINGALKLEASKAAKLQPDRTSLSDRVLAEIDAGRPTILVAGVLSRSDRFLKHKRMPQA